MQTHNAGDHARQGVLAGVLAYTLWGLFPVYFKQLGEVAALDVLAWRIVLCVVVLVGVLLLWRGPAHLWQRLRTAGDWPLVLAATAAISINWLTFIIAIDAGEVLQSSLGYFLVPLVNSGLGILVFKEQPNVWKRRSLFVAALGLSASFVLAGQLPWYALILAASFGVYGMLRKLMRLDSATGLLLETLCLAPIALVWLLFLGAPLHHYAANTQVWLMLAGVITLGPLLLMGFAAKRIELGTLGVLQYIAPVMHFLLALIVYDESLDPARTLAFATTVSAIALWLRGSPLVNARQKQA